MYKALGLRPSTAKREGGDREKQDRKKVGGKDVCVGRRDTKARPWGEERRLGGRYVKFYTKSEDGFWSHL